MLLGRHRKNRAATSPGPSQREKSVSLRCLGATALLQWNDLPTPIQQQLFDRAAATAESGQTAQLKEQIARLLHTYKDDARALRRGAGAHGRASLRRRSE